MRKAAPQGPPAWWTAADQAELDALAAELVHRLYEHRAWCPACERERREGWPCAAVTVAIEAVIDWRWRRNLLSRAEWLTCRHLAELRAKAREVAT